MKELTHMSLFTGIGGIDLAAEWAGFRTAGQCEIDSYAIKVLEKNFKNVERWRDIHDVTAESFRGRTGINAGELTLLSGGFPCQPHSLAGKRKASADERDLWSEFARVIRELRPKWVLGENVRGLLTSENGRFYGRILRDLDDMGYNVGWCCYGASDVGALHRRERVFIIAYADSQRELQPQGSVGEVGRRFGNGGKDDVSHTDGAGLEVTGYESGKQKIYAKNGAEYSGYDVSHADNGKIMWRDRRNDEINETEREWNNHGGRTPEYVTGEWWSAEPGVGRMAHGVPRRVDRLRCLGNAVVPQQVYPILECIAMIEKDRSKNFEQT